jgi:hypothetical protein
MKTIILSTLLLLTFNITFGQKKEYINGQKKEYINKEGWTNIGKFTFLFNQSAFSNWASGGDNTIAGNATVNYTINYKKNKFIWNNNVIATYGLTKSANTEFPKKTNDGFNINSMIAYDAENYWFYSFFANFKTQFTKGYKYTKVDGVETRNVYTEFMSPGYFMIGPGMFWEKNKDLKFNLAPATSRFVFVNPDLTLPDKAYFGVEEGESLRYEIGFSAALIYNFTLMENITIQNSLALFSNYIDNPQNIDLNYLMDIDLKVNKFFTANFIFQTVYDNNAYAGFQIREVIGIGINYNFEHSSIDSEI